MSALAVVAIGATAQSTKQLAASKANDYGVVYTLPKTAVDVTIEAQITVRQPGEFYKYAKKYLNIDNPITAPSVTADIVSATVTTHGVADQEQRYLVTLKGGYAPYLVVGDDNLPLAINTERTYRPVAVALPQAKKAEPTPLETDAARQVITEEMLQSNSSAKRAELAAQQIYNLRQSRTDLITGQADVMPPDGQAMKIVMDNINAQEQALMAMFVGTTSISTDVRTFTYMPDGDVADYVIARISAVNGITGSNDLSGFPVYMSMTETERGELPLTDKGTPLPFPKGGVAYCIPGKARIDITSQGRTLASSEVELSQLGVVYGMNPASFTDRKAPIYLIFNPATGAIATTGPATVAAQ
jgi:hypothetical protein